MCFGHLCMVSIALAAQSSVLDQDGPFSWVITFIFVRSMEGVPSAATVPKTGMMDATYRTAYLMALGLGLQKGGATGWSDQGRHEPQIACCR